MVVEIGKDDSNYIEQVVHMRYLMQFEEGVNENLIFSKEKEIKRNTFNFINEHLGSDLFIFGYVLDGKLVSTASLIVHKYFPNILYPNGYKGTLSNVYTLKDYRGRGFQKKLIKSIKDKAFELNMNSIRVNSNNEIAIKMYLKLGFIKNDNNYKINFHS